MKKLILLFTIVLTVSCSSDDDTINCTLMEIYGLNIQVVSTDPNFAIDGVTVVATDGSYSETLTNFENENQFYGAGRAGSYIITVTKEGYETYESSEPIEVTKKDECYVNTESLTVTLVPN